MTSKFSEQETEIYYDGQDDIYRSVWDEEGSVHWGVFDDNTGDNFLKACNNLDNMMAEKGQIKSTSNVLDLGCGNGTTAIWLNNDRGCHVTGVDLSGVRIGNAQEARLRLGQSAQNKLAFEKASAAELPFEDESFTHLWSQAVIYHVPDKESVLNEAYRVLKPGGIMVFDDSRDMIEVSHQAMEFFTHESCGKCFPCRIGTQRLMERLAGKAGPKDLESWIDEVADLGKTMMETSACGLGVAAPLITNSLLKYFPEQVSDHVTR